MFSNLFSSLLTPVELEAFLEEGLLVLKPDGQLLLGVGPFLGAKAPGKPGLGVYLPGFFGERRQVFYPSKSFILNTLSFGSVSSAPCLEPEWDAPRFNDFQSQVLEAQHLFNTSSLRKVVPVVRWKSLWSPNAEEKMKLIESVLSFSNRSEIKDQRAYTYGFWSKGHGFLGRTPEILFSQSQQTLKTMALAGTNWVGKGIQFLEDEKEKHEHQCVIDEILEKLGPLGRFEAGAMKTLAFGTIEHLYTPIEGELTQKTPITEERLIEITQRLHPTPALGGYPYSQAKAWLSSQSEAEWRGDFGAPLVVFNTSNENTKLESLCLVLIRGLFWTPMESFLPVGCGVVSGSTPEQEWIELEKKKNSVRSLFGWESK